MRTTRAGAVLGVIVIAVLFAATSATAARLITGAQIRDRSITIRDLAVSARPKAGRRGLPGPAGSAGPAGGLSAVTTVASAPVAYPPATDAGPGIGAAQAACPAGSTLVGGGFYNAAGGGTAFFTATAYNAPVSANAWGAVLINSDASEGDELVAVAQCATGTAARSAARTADPDAGAHFAKTLASLRARANR